MSKRAATSAAMEDEAQGALFDETAAPRGPYRSDQRALAEMTAMIETLAGAKSPPWSLRLLGWQQRTFAALAQKLTPIEAAALTARFEAELERLGPPEN